MSFLELAKRARVAGGATARADLVDAGLSGQSVAHPQHRLASARTSPTKEANSTKEGPEPAPRDRAPGPTKETKLTKKGRFDSSQCSSADAARSVLDLPLSRFATDGSAIETRVPWWPETIWFVPTAQDADVLVRRGVSRGRIWTAAELQQVAELDALGNADLRTIGTIKATFGATLIDALADAQPKVKGCRACTGTRFWRHVDGRALCAICTPPSGSFRGWIQNDDVTSAGDCR